MPYYRDAPPSYRGGGGSYRSGPSVLDLILNGGRIASEQSQRSGDIWGNAFAQAGQIAAGGLQAREQRQKQERADQAVKLAGSRQYPSATMPVPGSEFDVEDPGSDHMGAIMQNVSPEMRPDVAKRVEPIMQARQMAKRDAAITQDIASWDGKDPAALYKQLMTRTDPKTAMELAKGVASFHTLDGKADEKNLLAFDDVLQTTAKMPYPMVEQLWTGMRGKLTPGAEQFLGITADKIPETMTPEAFEGIKSLAASRSKEKPEKPAEHIVTTTGPNGQPMKRLATAEELRAGVPEYREPKVAAKPNLERVDSVDPATGKAVTKFVVPKEGDTFAKPTGQAKPATGAQKKALNFFNRAKEAVEAAESVEGDLAKLGPIDEARLGYSGPGAGYVQSDKMQSYNQAQRAFTEARLRKESGAAVPESEYENDRKTYWKVQGDSEATIAQKARMRKAVLAGIAFETGDALQEYYGDEAGGMLAELKKASAGSGRSPSAPPVINSPEEAAKLKPGTVFMTPDGRLKKVPLAR